MKKIRVCTILALICLFVVVLIACNKELPIPQIIVSEITEVEFDGEAHAVSAKLNISGGLQYLYIGKDNSYEDVEGPTQPGEYNVRLTYIGDNYFDFIEKTVVLKIIMPYDMADDDCTLMRYTGGKDSIILPETYKNKNIIAFGGNVYANNTIIKQIAIGGSIESFDASNIKGCTNLTTVILNKQIPLAGEFPDNFVYDVDGVALLNDVPSGVKKLVLSEKVTAIDTTTKLLEGVGCLQLLGSIDTDGLILPSSLKRIEVYSSADSSIYNAGKLIRNNFMKGQVGLEEIVIGDDIYECGDGAFENCPNLKSITLGSKLTINNGFYDSVSTNVLFSGKNNSVGKLKSSGKITVAEGLSMLSKEYCFSGIADNKVGPNEIDLPSTFMKLSNSLFAGCQNIEEIRLPQGMIIDEIPFNCFSGCRKLKSFVLPDGVTKIGARAFAGCNSLEEIIIPNSVEQIGMYAFSGCRSLKEIIVPDSVTEIGVAAFVNNSQLTSISILGNVSFIPNRIFYGCNNLEKVFLPSNVTQIATNMYLTSTIGPNRVYIYLNSQVPPTLLSTDTEYPSPKVGFDKHVHFIVEESLYNVYISDTAWSAYEERIHIAEQPESN